MRTYAAAATSGAVVVPATEIFSPYGGDLLVNDVAGYRMRYGPMTGAIDPRWLFADCDGSIETQGPSDGVAQSVASTSEDGIEGPDEVLRFAKVADPDDAAKSCFLLRWVEGDDAATMRTELSFSPTFTPVPRGAVCWIGFAIRIPQAWKSAGATDETMVFQVHETADIGDDVQPAPIGMLVKGHGMLMWARANPNATTLAAATTYTQVWSESSYPADTWQFFAVKLLSHYNDTGSLEVWRRVNGSTTKIVSYSGGNTYNNTGKDYVKSGIYYYDDEWSGGLTERVIHHKGLFQVLDASIMSETVLLDFLETI